METLILHLTLYNIFKIQPLKFYYLPPLFLSFCFHKFDTYIFMCFFSQPNSPPNLLKFDQKQFNFDFLLANHVARFCLCGKIELSYWPNFFYIEKGFTKTLRNDVIFLLYKRLKLKLIS